jgi:hypothetical protein
VIKTVLNWPLHLVIFYYRVKLYAVQPLGGGTSLSSTASMTLASSWGRFYELLSAVIYGKKLSKHSAKCKFINVVCAMLLLSGILSNSFILLT